MWVMMMGVFTSHKTRRHVHDWWIPIGRTAVWTGCHVMMWVVVIARWIAPMHPVFFVTRVHAMVSRRW